MFQKICILRKFFNLIISFDKNDLVNYSKIHKQERILYLVTINHIIFIKVGYLINSEVQIIVILFEIIH